jgi:hypothetical protein
MRYPQNQKPHKARTLCKGIFKREVDLLRGILCTISRSRLTLFKIFIQPTCTDKNIEKYAYVGLLMVLCLMLELMPLAITARLPVALFLILGVASMAYVSVQYLNNTCMLFV